MRPCQVRRCNKPPQAFTPGACARRSARGPSGGLASGLGTDGFKLAHKQIGHSAAVHEVAGVHQEVEVQLAAAHRQALARDAAQQVGLQGVDMSGGFVGVGRHAVDVKFAFGVLRDTSEVIGQFLQLVLQSTLIDAVTVGDVVGRKLGKRLQRAPISRILVEMR